MRFAGLDLPDTPPVPIGEFYSFAYWAGQDWEPSVMSLKAFYSAVKSRYKVFEVSRMGPRGGKWYAVRCPQAWEYWVRGYRDRLHNRMVRDSARRLGFLGDTYG